MPDPYIRPYLDTSVYLAAIKGEAGRVDIAQHILEDAKRGVFQIVSSTFLIAEVIRGRGQPAALTPQEERVIDEYVFHDFITWVEVDQALALDARRLARLHGLKPADAIHLASAIRGGADQLLRWNNGFRLAEGMVYDGVLVCEPHWYGQPEIEGFPE